MKTVLSFTLILLFAINLHAKLMLPELFSGGMILQRESLVPVWGWTDEGTKVTVKFGDQEVSAVAESDGKWMVQLKPLQASAEPQEMKISTSGESITIQNILVGDVWLCSGQSNMQWSMHSTASKAKNPRYQPIPDKVQQEIKIAKDPLLRQIAVKHMTSIDQKLTNFKSDGWIECSPKKMGTGRFSAVAYYFAKELRRELNIPIGIILSAWSGTKIEPWIPKSGYEKNPSHLKIYNEQITNAKERHKKWPKALEDFEKKYGQKIKEETNKKKRAKLLKKKPLNPLLHKELPSTLYNGMIHSLVPYAIKGFNWYQGEANARRSKSPESYKDLLHTLIKSWREVWGQGDLPFYFVQLANYKKVTLNPLETSGWATVCNQQRLALSLKNTGMAVTNDLGEAEDIHPKNKIDVGKRLSLWALAKDYGKDIVYSGPLYKESQFEGKTVRIIFDSVGSGLMVAKKELLDSPVEIDAPLKGFQICGSDRQWKWAEAKIISNDTVEVSHPDIKDPVEVRYAWSHNLPDINLYNKEGLPTSVFSAMR